MDKNKQLFVAIIVALSLVFCGTGYAMWKHSNSNKTEPSLSLLSGDDYTIVADGQSAGNGTGPLSQDKSASQMSSGLNVSADTAASRLGQISPTQNNSSSSAGGSSSNASSPSPLDPSTFAQYDKYKTGEAGLFGEIKAGTGAELTAGKKAAVFYKGWLTSGQLFDQSRAGSDGKIQPFVFTLGDHQVIAGWEQALAGMKVGGTRLLIVPPAVGYGASGQGSIPGNSVLVFQVELAGVQ